MPTSCPIKQNPIHVAWYNERAHLRSDVIFTKTVVQPEYKGQLFRKSLRYAPKRKRKKHKKKRPRVPIYGTMGSYSIKSKEEELDEAQHVLSSRNIGNKILKQSRSSCFPKAERILGKTLVPLKLLQSPIELSKSVLSLSSSCPGILFSQTQRTTNVPIVPNQIQLSKEEITQLLVKPTKDGIPQNKTWKRWICHQIETKMPRPCSKSITTIAKNIRKSNKIEEQVRKKHRMVHQKKRLKSVRQKFARRYSTIPMMKKAMEDEFQFNGDSWTLPFNVEGSYESPFLGTSHHTRNVTVLSPVKKKQQK